MLHPVFTDSHCHFDFPVFDEDRQRVWHQCQRAGVSRLLMPGVEPAQWPRLQALREQCPEWFYAVGLHPWWIAANTAVFDDAISMNAFKDMLMQHVDNAGCVAIGECGLDAMVDIPMAQQQKILALHCEVAEAINAPLILHCRKAHGELLATLKPYNVRGVIHAFSGSAELARQYIAKGFLLGVGGVMTYTRANKTRTAIRHTPLEYLLLETDSPDMPLAGFQGQRNSPVNIPVIATALADLKSMPLSALAAQCHANVNRLFFD